MQLFILLVAVATFVAAEPNSVKFHNCKSSWEIKDVKVDPCPQLEAGSCPLKKGTSPEITVNFVPNREAKNLTVSVTGIVNNVAMPFPLDNDNACLGSGLTCPLVSGQEYSYKLRVPILAIYPNVQVLIRWNLQGKDGQASATDDKKHDLCFIMKTRIID